MLKRFFNQAGAVIICLALISSLSACQKSAASIIKDKDFDDLLDEANNPSPDNVSIQEITQKKPKEYVTTLENEEGTLKVNVNADIEIPDTTQLSVYSVKQSRFTQEFIDKVCAELLGNEPLYNGDALDVLQDIEYYHKSIADTGSKTLQDVFQSGLDELLAGFDLDSEDPTLQNFPSNCILKTTKELYDSNSYYERINKLYPDGEVVHSITDGTSGKYALLYVLNSSNYSNKLIFSSNPISHKNYYTTSIDTETFEKHFGSTDMADDSNSKTPENYTAYTSNKQRFVPIKTESCSLSAENAVSQAEVFLKKIGLDEFHCYDSQLSNIELFSVDSTDIAVYRTAYTLTFYRKIDGVFLTQSSGTKNNMSISGPDSGHFGKKMWYGESITILVNDNGIVGFNYYSPLEITEKVVETVAVKPFEEVKESFENTMVAKETYSYTASVYNVELVRLSYSRISEGTSNYETGLIVPMWDFYGNSTMKSLGSISHRNGVSFLAVNAIDGTIIDPDNGFY